MAKERRRIFSIKNVFLIAHGIVFLANVDIKPRTGNAPSYCSNPVAVLADQLKNRLVGLSVHQFAQNLTL